MAAKVIGVQFADNSFVNFESNDEEWDRCQDSGVDGVFSAEMCQQKARECGLHLTSTEVQSLVLGGFKEAAEVGCLYQVDQTGDGELNEKIPKYEKTPDGNICWSHAAVLLLISLYRQFEEKNAFSSGTSRKQAVWKAIAIEMNKHGYPYVSEQCDKKWRSLKYRYKHILENTRHNRISRKKWEYFELMGEILEEDKSMQHSPLIISCNANGNQQSIPGAGLSSPKSTTGFKAFYIFTRGNRGTR
ncbi:uncharacterized protein LOC112558977 isoform X2 [Pomacea canaliculata]|uniref:uncharacterized protein LOC112558977 isoform X2 n=1 Tax=Pomacea canaliculata TaxID=400727 RepID=UPI000D7334D8|nr:uncharacterized protein LOC112558977 isoform X2 [Pomacea canaliculata]